MPQIQILGREQAEDQNNQANQAIERQKITNDIFTKAYQLKLYRDEIKAKIKMSQDEVEKIRLAKQDSSVERGIKVVDNAYKIAKEQGAQPAQDYLVGVQKMYPDLFPGIMESGLGEKLGKMEKSGEVQKQEADALNARSEAGMNTAVTNKLNGIGIPASTGAGGQPEGEGAPNQPAVNAMSGGLVNSGMNIKGIQFDNYDIQARGAAMKTSAVAEATRAEEMKPIRASVGNYLSTFDEAVKEMGGLETNALAALAKGKMAQVGAQIGDMPNVFALSKLIESVSLQLGSYLNKGRPTDKDQSAAKDALTRITYTKGANTVMRNYLETIVANGDKDLATKLFWSLAKSGGSNSADAKAFGSSDMLSNKPTTSRYTIREKK